MVGGGGHGRKAAGSDTSARGGGAHQNCSTFKRALHLPTSKGAQGGKWEGSLLACLERGVALRGVRCAPGPTQDKPNCGDVTQPGFRQAGRALSGATGAGK